MHCIRANVSSSWSFRLTHAFMEIVVPVKDCLLSRYFVPNCGHLVSNKVVYKARRIAFNDRG